MNWIVVAIIANTLWTLRCALVVPSRVATHFGMNGAADGWMSRKGFAIFGIFTPIAIAGFIVYMGNKAPSQTELPVAMQNLAVGLIIFFAFLNWCIVRSNRKTPPRIDYPSLAVSIGVLLVFMVSSMAGISNGVKGSKQAVTSKNSATN